MTDVHHIALRSAAAALADDRHARRVAVLPPGLEGEAGGRLREQDRAALVTALTQGEQEQWQRWRTAAAHVLAANIEDSSWPGQPDPGPLLVHRLSQVRWMRVRRQWYDHPDLSPTVVLEDGSDGLR